MNLHMNSRDHSSNMQLVKVVKPKPQTKELTVNTAVKSTTLNPQPDSPERNSLALYLPKSLETEKKNLKPQTLNRKPSTLHPKA